MPSFSSKAKKSPKKAANLPTSKSEKGSADSSPPQSDATGTETAATIQQEAKIPKKMPKGLLKLQFAGSLVLVKNPQKELAGLSKRFESFFEALANMDPIERTINYKFLVGLMLTSHAKKTIDIPERRKIFDLKNEIFFSLANDRETRRKLAFMYLSSKNYRVLEFCAACTESNTAAGLKRHAWKYCKECKLDRNFFNVLSMHHKFTGGSVTLFLSNDLMHKVQGLQIKKKGQLEDTAEEAMFGKYHYNVRNLDAVELKCVVDWHKKLLATSH